MAEYDTDEKRRISFFSGRRRVKVTFERTLVLSRVFLLPSLNFSRKKIVRIF